jgi:hypothetical protein
MAGKVIFYIAWEPKTKMGNSKIVPKEIPYFRTLFRALDFTSFIDISSESKRKFDQNLCKLFGKNCKVPNPFSHNNDTGINNMTRFALSLYRPSGGTSLKAFLDY